jgi:hypothetical protein
MQTAGAFQPAAKAQNGQLCIAPATANQPSAAISAGSRSLRLPAEDAGTVGGCDFVRGVARGLPFRVAS